MIYRHSVSARCAYLTHRSAVLCALLPHRRRSRGAGSNSDPALHIGPAEPPMTTDCPEKTATPRYPPSAPQSSGARIGAAPRHSVRRCRHRRAAMRWLRVRSAGAVAEYERSMIALEAPFGACTQRPTRRLRVRRAALRVCGRGWGACRGRRRTSDPRSDPAATRRREVLPSHRRSAQRRWRKAAPRPSVASRRAGSPYGPVLARLEVKRARDKGESNPDHRITSPLTVIEDALAGPLRRAVRPHRVA